MKVISEYGRSKAGTKEKRSPGGRNYPNKNTIIILFVSILKRCKKYNEIQLTKKNGLAQSKNEKSSTLHNRKNTALSFIEYLFKFELFVL